jgi:hypothetical protein
MTNITDDIATVLSVPGTTVPVEYETVLAGWKHANAVRHAPLEERIADVEATLLTGDGDAITRALREYEATRALKGDFDLFKRLERTIMHRLRSAYASVAATNYATVAAAWQATADELTAAVQKVKPSAPVGDVLRAPAAVRTAWEVAPALADDLSRLAPILRTAARLAGVEVNDPSLRADDAILSLTVDPGTLHRRRVWEAWDTTTHRAGRWGALLELGAALRVPELDSVAAYRRPRPIETRYERTRLGFTPYQYDPEDGPDERGGLTAGRVAVAR